MFCFQWRGSLNKKFCWWGSRIKKFPDNTPNILNYIKTRKKTQKFLKLTILFCFTSHFSLTYRGTCRYFIRGSIFQILKIESLSSLKNNIVHPYTGIVHCTDCQTLFTNVFRFKFFSREFKIFNITRLQPADPDQAQKLFTDGLLHALLSLPQDNQNTCTVEYLLSAMIL